MMSLLSFVDSFDIFKIPVSLLIKENTRSSTLSGKILSTIVFVYIFVSFSQSDLMQKSNPTIYRQDTKISERPKFNFGRDELSLVVGLSDVNNNFEFNDRVFNIKSFIRHYSSSLPDEMMMETNLEVCKENDFTDPTIFKKLNLNNTLCLPKGNYNISGFWDEEELYYLNYELNFCENTTENNNHCLPQEEIFQYFLEKDRYLSFFINDVNIDASNAISRPFTSKMSTIYFIVDIKLRKSYEVFLKQTNLITTEGFLIQEEKIESTFQLDSINKDLNTFNSGSYNVGFVTFLSSDLQTDIKRKYSDLQEAFSNMSGILNCILALGFILSNIENNFRTVRVLTNNLFTFQDPSMIGNKKTKIQKKKEGNEMINEKKGKKEEIKLIQELFLKKKSVLIPKTEKIFISEKKEFQPQTSLSSLRNKMQEKIPQKISFLNQYLKFKPYAKSDLNIPIQRIESFESFKQSQNKFEFGFFKFLKIMTKCKRFFLTNQEKLFLKAEHEIKCEMDIIEILKKLQDIERLKKILLNKNEHFLFDLLDKPYIFLDQDELNDRKSKNLRRIFSWANKNEKTKYKKNKILKNFLLVKNSDSEIGQRILHLIDRDLMKFLEIKEE